VTRAEAFDLVGDGGVGVVLVHGFTGTPYEVRYLGEQLWRAGWSAYAPLLPGHGTTIGELERTTWHDWLAAVGEAIERLQKRHRHVALVGQSLGGLLALVSASRRRDICAVVSLAAPLWLRGLAKWAARLPLRTLPKIGGSDARDPRVRAENPGYRAIPMRALRQVLDVMRVADAALPAITQPVLVVHAQNDHTAPVACAQRIAERARARRVRILPRSYHLIAADVERDVVAAEVLAFIRGEPACAT